MKTKSKAQARAVRDAVVQAITIMGLTTARSFLSFAGILPLFLADGTRVVVLPDIHAPAHNRRVIWAIMQFMSWYKPHVIFFVGDVADIYALSKHPKGLRTVNKPQWELEVTRRLMDEIMESAGPQLQWTFVILGNHEDRVYRFLQDMAPQLGGMLDYHSREPMNFHSMLGYTAEDNITFLYGMDERGGFEGGVLLNDDLGIHHGIIVAPKAGLSPLKDMQRYSRSRAHGHTHRLGCGFMDKNPRAPFPTGVGRWYELGMLADMDHSFMAYAKRMFPNWHMGFAAGEVYDSVVHLATVPIRPINDEQGRSRFGFEWENVDGESRVFYESDR
jgi:hypothetical protein